MKIKVNCKNCNDEFEKYGNEIKRTKSNFCSKSCSAKWNNVHNPKRHLKMDVTLEEYKVRGCSYRTYKTRICEHARRVFGNNNKGKVVKCSECGYDKFYQVCHIKNVSSFPLSTKIGVVNKISNLVALCPNCHWEFDHGFLKLER